MSIYKQYFQQTVKMRINWKMIPFLIQQWQIHWEKDQEHSSEYPQENKISRNKPKKGIKKCLKRSWQRQ